MARYHEIETSFWDDPEIQGLTPHQKLLYVYLFSNSLVRPSGLYRISRKTVDFHLELGKALETAWEGLIQAKKIMWDAPNSLVWVVGKMNRYRESLKNPNNPIKRSVDHDVAEFQKSSLISLFLDKYKGLYSPIEGVLETLQRVHITTPIPIPSDVVVRRDGGGMGEEGKPPAPARKVFQKPTPAEVTEYAKSIGFELKGEQFWDHYEAKNWMIGKTKMSDWKAAVRTWRHNHSTEARHDGSKGQGTFAGNAGSGRANSPAKVAGAASPEAGKYDTLKIQG